MTYRPPSSGSWDPERLLWLGREGTQVLNDWTGALDTLGATFGNVGADSDAFLGGLDPIVDRLSATTALVRDLIPALREQDTVLRGQVQVFESLGQAVSSAGTALAGLFGVGGGAGAGFAAGGAGGLPSFGASGGGGLGGLGSLFGGGLYSATLADAGRFIGNALVSPGYSPEVLAMAAAQGTPLNSGLANFLGDGLGFSPYGAFGGLGAGLLGLGHNNALVNAGAGFAGSVVGGGLGAGLSALGSFGGPVGSVLGGFAGSALSGFFGGGASNQSAGVTFDPVTGHVYYAGSKGDANVAARDALQNAIETLSDRLVDLTGGSLADRSVQIDVGSRDGIQWWVGNTATGNWLNQGVAAIGDYEGAVQSIITALAGSIEGVPDDLAAQLAGAGSFAGLDQVLAGAVQGRNAGLATGAFDADVRQRLLSFTDPLAAMLAEVDTWGEALREEARLVGGDLVQVERLVATRRQEVLDDHADQVRDAERRALADRLRDQEDFLEVQVRDGAQALRVLERGHDDVLRTMERRQSQWDSGLSRATGYLDQVLGTPGAGRSPTAALSYAESLFDRTRQAALGGDVDAVSGLPDAARLLLGASEAVYGSGAAYQERLGFVTATLRNLPTQAPGNGSADVVAALRQQIAVQQDDNRKLQDELARLRDSLERVLDRTLAA